MVHPQGGLGAGALLVVALAALVLARHLPTAFLPEEDQGYAFAQAQLPFAASLGTHGRGGEENREAS